MCADFIAFDTILLFCRMLNSPVRFLMFFFGSFDVKCSERVVITLSTLRVNKINFIFLISQLSFYCSIYCLSGCLSPLFLGFFRFLTKPGRTKNHSRTNYYRFIVWISFHNARVKYNPLGIFVCHLCLYWFEWFQIRCKSLLSNII